MEKQALGVIRVFREPALSTGIVAVYLILTEAPDALGTVRTSLERNLREQQARVGAATVTLGDMEDVHVTFAEPCIDPQLLNAIISAAAHVARLSPVVIDMHEGQIEIFQHFYGLFVRLGPAESGNAAP